MHLTLPTQTLPGWQEQLAGVVTDPAELLRLLELTPQQAGLDTAALAGFPLRVTQAYLRRMRKGDPDDPLLRQVLPVGEEMLDVDGFGKDPLKEASANGMHGLLHKYRGRVLLITTQSCAIHCRYCFRRHFPYADNRNSRAEWGQVIAAIAADDSITEVILSGGDPLATSNTFLAWLVRELAAIGHLRRLRLHSRLPVILPDRIDAALLQALAQWPFEVVMVVHANHAQEFDTEVDAACARMRAAGITLLNQSVLLKGINDSAELLKELSERLFAAGVLPYYLHMLDKVQGAAHFAVSDAAARALHATLRATLPGYLVPRLVRELPGEPGKTPL